MAISSKNIQASLISAMPPTALPIQSGDGDDEVCRYFSEFNGTNSQAELVSNINISGDYEIEVLVQTTDTSKDWAIIDSSTFNTPAIPAGSSILYVDNPDGLEFLRGDGAGGFERDIFGGQTAICSGAFNVVSVKRVGGTMTATLNDNALGSPQSVNTGDVYFDTGLFGGAGRSLLGIGANVKIWEGGDRDTGTLIFNLPMDESTIEGDGTINYINRVDDTVGAIGHNITPVRICEGDNSDWGDLDLWNDSDVWYD